MITFLGKKMQFLREKNYLKMNNSFLPQKKIGLDSEANVIFFNFKK